MINRLAKLLPLFMLLIATGYAQAEPKRFGQGFLQFGGRQENREVLRAERFKRFQERRNENGVPNGEEPDFRANLKRSERQNELSPENERPQETRRRYLTPEERRALRKRIQDAGNEIYTPPN